MYRQGPDFHFEISGYRDKRGRDNESQLYYICCIFIDMPGNTDKNGAV